MNCREFRQRLGKYVGARLPAATWEEADRHATTCARCSALVTTLAPPALSDRDRDALVDNVLRQTTGASCEQAQAAFGPLIDDELDRDTQTLVGEHVQYCATCHTVFTTMLALSSDLASIAEIDPGEAFTTAVLRSTSGAHATSTARPQSTGVRVSIADQLRTFWENIIARPRFSLEAAYVGTLVLVLLFGMPRSPYPEVPTRAIQFASLNPVQVFHERQAWVESMSFDLDAWPVLGTAYSKATALADRGRRVGPLLDQFQAHLGSTGAAIWNGDADETWRQIIATSNDVLSIWHVVGSVDPSPDDSEAPTSTERKTQ